MRRSRRIEKICDVLHDLLPFVQFKKRKNTHGGVLHLVKLKGKSNTPPWYFSRFLSCTNRTKLRNASHYHKNNDNVGSILMDLSF